MLAKFASRPPCLSNFSDRLTASQFSIAAFLRFYFQKRAPLLSSPHFRAMTEPFFWSAASGAAKHVDKAAMKLEDNSPTWNEHQWIPGERALRFSRIVSRNTLLDTPSPSSCSDEARFRRAWRSTRYQFAGHHDKERQRCLAILCTLDSSAPLISREGKNISVRDLPPPRLSLFPLMILPGDSRSPPVSLDTLRSTRSAF